MTKGTIRKCEYCNRVFILNEKSNLFIEQPQQLQQQFYSQQRITLNPSHFPVSSQNQQQQISSTFPLNPLNGLYQNQQQQILYPSLPISQFLSLQQNQQQQSPQYLTSPPQQIQYPLPPQNYSLPQFHQQQEQLKQFQTNQTNVPYNNIFSQPSPHSPSPSHIQQQEQQLEFLTEPLQPTDQQNKGKSEENEDDFSLYDNKNNYQKQIEQSKQQQNEEEEKRNKVEKGLSPDEIKKKLFFNKCPLCDSYILYDERMECKKCNKIWKRNQKTALFSEELNNEKDLLCYNKNNKKQIKKNLNSEEEIKMKLFEGKCPSCNNYSKKLENGEKRKCDICKTVWKLNKETNFFYEEGFQKISDNMCPKCNLSFNVVTPFYEMMRCSKCKNIYKWNYTIGKYFNTTFVSLEMTLESHSEYDCLSLIYLYRRFTNLNKEEIKKRFFSCKHLLIPTVSHLKISSLKKKKEENEEIEECYSAITNIYYLDDIHILDSKERTELYLTEFNKKKKELLESKVIIKYFHEKKNKKEENEKEETKSVCSIQ
jgi:hypothetical protein